MGLINLSRFRAWSQEVQDRFFAQRLEAIAALALLLLGLWIFFTPNPLSYAYLTQFAPQQFWGLLLIAVGITSRLGVYYNNRNLRRVGMLLVFACRLGLLYTVVVGTHGLSTTTPEQVTWVIASIWAYTRLDSK